jgi:hypothetical protein
MVQSLIVGLIVGGAVLYSLWVLLPAAVRRSTAARMARQAARWGLGAPQAARLQSTLETAGACSECAKCQGCATTRGMPQAPRSQAPAAHDPR